MCFQEEGYEEIQGEIEMLRQCRNPRRRVSLGKNKESHYLSKSCKKAAVLVIFCAWMFEILGQLFFVWQIVIEYCGGGSVPT